MIHLQSLTRQELVDLIMPLGPEKARYRAQQIFRWVYQRFVTDWDQMTDLSQLLRAWLQENIQIHRFTQRQMRQSEDGTMKVLWDLSDHKTVESVIIPAEDRWTACISSQVGCAMACQFCLTGIQGLDRHLQVDEIITQVFELRKMAPITNIVFMGMGEPLHNVDRVISACKILLDEDGLNFSKRKVTVSTSGIVPAIQKLGQSVDVSLAVSLNATTNEKRSQIMPINRKWDIEALLDSCRNYPLGSHRRITFEYVLLKDFNDSLEDADRLNKLLSGIRCKINLIPFNEHFGSTFQRPADGVVSRFQKYLVDRKLTATIRTSRGRDILAACGQLRSLIPHLAIP